MAGRVRSLLVWAALGGLVGGVASCGSSTGNAAGATAGRGAGQGGSRPAPARNGNLVVLEPLATTGGWSGFDPPTDTSAALNYDYLNAIYGELFEPGPKGTVVDDLATGYRLLNRDTELDIDLRRGVTFTDGTPFDAQAVAFNIQRDLDPKLACHCRQNFAAVRSVQAVGDHEVVLHLSQPDPSIVDAFIAEAPNWIVSPTALQKTSEADFALHPVGAGPFEWVSGVPSSVAKLQRNPHYWQAGRPYLDTLTFQTVGSDASAYEALAAGSAEVDMQVATASIVSRARGRFQVVAIPATAVNAVELGNQLPPFNDIRAREAIYYATDPVALNKVAGGLGSYSQSPTGPGDRYYEPVIPGYRHYDPAKARALVKSLGGLRFKLATLPSPLDVQMVEALKSEWAEVGIDATIEQYNIPTIVKLTEQHALQAIYGSVGAYDPALIPGVGSFFTSTGPFSQVKYPALDRLVDQATQALDPATAAARWHAVFRYLSDQAVAPFLFTNNAWDLADRAVRGIPASTSEVAWEDVARS